MLRAILEHLGLPADSPAVAPARTPPEPELPFTASVRRGAMQLGQSVEDPPVLNAAALPDDLPGIVVYASIHGDFYTSSPTGQAKSLKARALNHDFAPDLLIYAAAGSAYAGSTSQYIGYGAAVSTPVYRPQAWVYCFRLSPVSLGLYWNENMMLTSVQDGVREECGLQEGDTLLSFNDRPIQRSGESVAPGEMELLRLSPGDLVELVWIRPGTGRMEGTMTAMPPRPLPDYPSMVEGLP